MRELRLLETPFLILIFYLCGSTVCPELIMTAADSPPSPSGTIPHVPGGIHGNYSRQIERALSRRYPGATTRLLDSGAECLVYEICFNRQHALVLKFPRHPHDLRVQENFRRERSILRAARREDSDGARYLVELYGLVYWEEIQQPVLVLGRARHGSLGGRLHTFGPQEAKERPRRFLHAWRQMAFAVRSLHRIEYVHRDIKPNNFLVDEDEGKERFRLTDFGLSARQGRRPPRLEGILTGTLTHMSENQRGRGTAEYADDVYALLTTYREMLIGISVWRMNPADPANRIELRNVDEFGTYPILLGLPERVRRDASAELIDIVDGEYRNIDELVNRIERALRRIG